MYDLSEIIFTILSASPFSSETIKNDPSLTSAASFFKERIINPAVATVANKIDRDVATYAYQNIPNAVGTPGTPPASFLSFTLAGAVLDGEAAPRDGKRVVILDPFSMAYAQDSVTVSYTHLTLPTKRIV